MTTESSRADTRRRIILHCGAPKTGSTSLQNFFADNRATLAEDGVAYPLRFFRRGEVDPLHDGFKRLRARKRPEEKLFEDMRARVDAFFQEDGVRTLLISNESILGEPFHPDRRGFFPKHGESAKQLARIFEGYDVSVVYFIRDFESFLPSYYVQYVRMGGYLSFERFCAHMGSETLSWQPVVTSLRKAFGAANVACFDAADMRRAPDATIKAAFGAFMPSLPAFDAARYNQNQAVGAAVLGCYRVMNRLLDNMFPIARRRQVRPLVRQYLFEPLAYLSRLASGSSKPEPVAPPPAKQAIKWQQQYRADRTALGLN